MATKYTLNVEADVKKVHARKETAIKAGEATGLAFSVQTDSGAIVHTGTAKVVPIKPAKKAAAPKPAKPKPAKPPKPVLEDDEDAEKPMTKGEAYAWFKRCREGLRDAERAIERGDVKQAHLTDLLADSMGAISELLAAFDETGNGINGVV